MFGAGQKRQIMMETLRQAQAKNLSIEKARLTTVIAPLDMRNSKLKANAEKKQKLKRAGVANPKEVFEDILEKWEKGKPAFQTAIEKLANRAIRFDKNKEGEFIKAFETVSLDLPNFRIMLRRVFQLTFSDEEFDATCVIFDRNGAKAIDGNEFLVCFSLLGALAKSKRAEGIRKAEQMLQAKDAAIASERRARLLAKGERKIEYDYTPADRDSAMDKYRTAAKKFDKSHPSSMGLTGFDEKFLTPQTFREIVKLTFGLKLSNKELGAMMDFIDPKKEGIVHSANFLQGFLRLGIEQRAQALNMQLKTSKEAEEARVAEAEKLREEVEASKELKVDLSATPKEAEETMEKLRVAAIKYNPSNSSSLGLDGFATKLLKPGAFREMLKRTFGYLPTAKELGVLVNHFGDEQKKFIVSEKFLLYFKRVGIKGRQKKHSENVERQRQENEERAREAKRKLEEQFKKLDKGFDPKAFTKADGESADKKLRAAAYKLDKGGRGVPVESFMSKHMEAGVFRELTKRVFGLILTNGELAAVVNRFKDGSGHVDCQVFMTQLTRLSTEEKNKKAAEQREIAREIAQKLKNEGSDKRAENMKKMDKASVVTTFTKEDVASAKAKLHAAHATLQASSFQTNSMSPGLFRMMLKRTFNVDLKPAELTAIIDPYLNREGDVQIKPFILDFFSMHKEKRNEKRSTVLMSNKEAAQKMAEIEEKRKEAHRLQALAKLAYSDETRKECTEKLRTATYAYACDSASFMAPLQLFKGPAMAAHAFKDQFYRTFMIRMSLQEVGLMMDMLDPKLAQERMISGEQFLKAFFKIGRLQEKVLLGNMEENQVHPLQVLKESGKSKEGDREDERPAFPTPKSPNQGGGEKDRKQQLLKKIRENKDSERKGGFLTSICGGRNPYHKAPTA